MTTAARLHEDLVLLLVDVQEGFLDAMQGDRRALEARLIRLARLARGLELPVVATIEVPEDTKGGLASGVADELPPGTVRVPKTTFDAMAGAGFPELLAGLGRRTVAVAGAETDVCVLLTVEGLLAAGYRVHLLEDCVFSSTRDPQAAIARMRQGGAVPTTLKTLAFELTGTVDRDAWPARWREALARDPHLFPDSDEIAPQF